MWQVRLSCLTVDEVCSLIKRLPLSGSATVDALCQRFREINASGLVLSFCDLDNLKSELRANFGDWELIALMIRTLRSRERDYGQMDDVHSRAQSIEPTVALPVRKYSSGLPGAGGGGHVGVTSTSAMMAKRRGTSARAARKKTISGSGNTIDSSSDHVAEVVAQQDWLHNRLGHLNSTEFIGDRDLVDSTPRTSRRSSIIREESMGFPSETNSYEDVHVMSPPSGLTSPGQLTRDMSPSAPPGGAGSGASNGNAGAPTLVIAGEEGKSNLAHRLKGLVQSIGGTTDETGRLLVVQSSDTDDEEEKAQLTVKRKPEPEPRPSVFQLVQTTRAASVPNVNTMVADTLMEMGEMITATSTDQTASSDKAVGGSTPDSRF